MKSKFVPFQKFNASYPQSKVPVRSALGKRAIETGSERKTEYSDQGEQT